MNETGDKELDPGTPPGMEEDPAALLATMGTDMGTEAGAETGAETGAGEGDSAWTGEGGGGLAAPAGGDEAGPINIDLIMDLPLQVVVELGRTKMLINDLLQIGQGSVIELNKQVGEPLDILVNGKLVARGEVVVVRDKFGIRITDVISPIERIKQLG